MSCVVGTTRVFRLREVIPTDEKDKRSARTYNIPLVHNSVRLRALSVVVIHFTNTDMVPLL